MLKTISLSISFLSTVALAIEVIEGDIICAESEVPFGSSLCKPIDECYKDAYKFLEDNLPSWDKSNADTLGFHNETTADVDGLDQGIATLGINISLSTKQRYPWAGSLSEDIFYEYVVPYAHVNEPRNNWRPYLTDVVNRIILENVDIEDPLLSVENILTVINTHLWSKQYLGNDVVFKSSQTPLIYDPMSTIVYGYASCTGVSILFADALRCAGVATRVAGTPAWNGDYANGNHNWIEVFDPTIQEWKFIEAAPAGAGETLSNPCDKWFCTPDRMRGGTQFFATRWSFDGERTVYPMAWDRNNIEIPGVNMTHYYQTVCNIC